MFTMKRISKTPDSPIRILVQEDQQDGDAGLTMGGSFMFFPAGQEGDQAAVSEVTARGIMADPSLAPHFEVTPALPGTDEEAQPDVQAAPRPGGKKARG